MYKFIFIVFIVATISCKTESNKELKKNQTPFLVIASDHDIITIDHSVSLYKHLPNAYLFIVPNASHLSLAEFPNFINGEIIRF